LLVPFENLIYDHKIGKLKLTYTPGVQFGQLKQPLNNQMFKVIQGSTIFNDCNILFAFNILWTPYDPSLRDGVFILEGENFLLYYGNPPKSRSITCFNLCFLLGSNTTIPLPIRKLLV
jgi:hypothetical protein